MLKTNVTGAGQMAAERLEAEVGIPEPTIAGHLQCKWNGGNEVAVFPTCDYSYIAGSAAKSESVNDFNVWQLQLNVDRYRGLARRVISESHDIFLEVQDTGNLDSAAKQQILMKYSRLYRAILRTSITRNSNKGYNLKVGSYDSKKTEEVYAVIELIWQLCEILFVDILQGGYAIQNLLNWIIWHFPKIDDMHKEMILETTDIHNHPNYWAIVYGYVITGRMSSAIELLNASIINHNEKNDPYVVAKELLRKMPQPQPSPEYVLKWRHWQQECRNRLANDFKQHTNLNKLCRILCGDEKVYRELSAEGVIETWYQLLVVHILFCNPTTKVYDLHYTMDLAITLFFDGRPQLGKLDEIISALLQLDTVRVIKEISSGFGDWWFAAHLTDLLYHCGQLKLYKLDYGSDLREYLLLEYGSALMNANLWQIGSDYLGHCYDYGRYYLQQYVRKISLDSERKARKVIHICRKYDLQAEVMGTCREMGMTAIRRGKLGSAISWAMIARDVAFIDFVVDRYLSSYQSSGSADCLAIMDDIGTTITLSGKLAFLGKFREFHRLLNERNLADAASILVMLMVDGLAPKKYWWMLLLNAIPLFETDEIVLDSHQTYELIRCLTEIELSLWGPNFEGKNSSNSDLSKNSEIVDSQLNIIRVALARNLARTHLDEEQP